MISSSLHVMVGLPDTGKSTFLAALCNVVNVGDVPGSLRLERLEGNRAYVNGIWDDWLRFKKLERTKLLENPSMTSMILRDSTGQRTVEVVFPDIAGEQFRQVFEKDRKWPKNTSETVGKANGYLVFLHPDQVVEPISIISVKRNAETGDAESTPEEIHPWSISESCTAVKLIDLIQSLLRVKERTEIVPLAIVISAWDIVEKRQALINPQTPEQWFQDRLPLLQQYLKANPECLRHAIFGISALGGDLEDDKERLQKILLPSQRIRVHFNGRISNDITLPIKWLMNYSTSDEVDAN